MEPYTMFKMPQSEEICRVQNQTDAPVIADAQTALDLIATVRHGYGCTKLVVAKEDIAEDFFDLKTRLAGEILQKFVNYGVQIAIVGDFSGYTSKSLRDFIYESNKGSAVVFVKTEAEAAEKLKG